MDNMKPRREMPMGKDFAETVELWKRAAEQGDGRCAVNLGLLHLGKPIPGKGKIGELPYDEKKALEYFNLGYEAGDMKAGRHIGLCYKDGTGVDQNAEKAYEWFLKAAERGDSSAKLLIADSLLTGDGTEQRVEEAIARYKALADIKGHDTANASYRLGCIYNEGVYTARDTALSRMYLEKTIASATDHEKDLAQKAKEILSTLN